MSEKLSDVVTIISGGTPKTSVKEFWDGDIDWLAVADFNSSNRYVSSASKKITELGLNNSNTKMLEKGDLIISARGTVGAIAQLTIPMAFNQSCFGLRGKKDKLDTDYLYYWLKNYVDVLLNKSQGSVFNTINLSTFDDIKIELPSIADQRKISNLLTLLDDKIEINNQINQELEAMAKTLYDYWFVQFDFPDQNGKPYKSSGGKMVYHPELKREIPEGWGVEKLSEFLVLNKDKYNKELNWQKIHYLETSNLIENKIEKLKKLDIKSDKIPSRAKEIVKDRDILYSLVRPNQMHFGFIRNPIQNLVASTGFVLLSCEDNPIYNIFFYLFMTLPNNVRRMIKLSESSTSSYPSIRPEDILNMDIVTPYDFSNYRSLVEYLDKIYYQIDVLYKQNEALIQLRDWLLPMLMNGQVKVER